MALITCHTVVKLDSTGELIGNSLECEMVKYCEENLSVTSKRRKL